VFRGPLFSFIVKCLHLRRGQTSSVHSGHYKIFQVKAMNTLPKLPAPPKEISSNPSLPPKPGAEGLLSSNQENILPSGEHPTVQKCATVEEDRSLIQFFFISCPERRKERPLFSFESSLLTMLRNALFVLPRFSGALSNWLPCCKTASPAKLCRFLLPRRYLWINTMSLERMAPHGFVLGD